MSLLNIDYKINLKALVERLKSLPVFMSLNKELMLKRDLFAKQIDIRYQTLLMFLILMVF